MKQLQRLSVYEPNGLFIGSVSMPSSFQLSTPLNDISAMNIDIVDSMLGWDHLLNVCEVAYEYSVNDGATWIEPSNARFLRLANSYNAVGDAHVSRKYTLPGYGWLLQRACNMKTTGLNEDGKRPFLSVSPGAIMKTLIDEARTRSTLPGLTYDFSATHDSDGQPWTTAMTIYYSPGIDLMTILRNLSDTGACDWKLRGRVLRMFRIPATPPAPRAVNLEPGRDILGLPVTSSLENIVHRSLLVADAGKALVKERTTTPQPWGMWESSLTQGAVSDTVTMNLMLDTNLESGSRPQTQYTVELDFDRTVYEVFSDYEAGDYITSVSNDGGREAFRVRSINIDRSEDGSRRISLILNDRFLEREIQVARRVSGIVNGSRGGGLGTAGPVTPNDDTRLPKPPTGLVASSTIGATENGVPGGIVSLAWQPVSQATDSSPLDIDRYDIYSCPRPYAQNAAQPFSAMTKVAEARDSFATFGTMVPGTVHDYAVIAVAMPGVRRSLPSAVVSVMVAEDITAPDKLMPPTATSKSGMITVRHNGLSTLGNQQPADWLKTMIYRSGLADPIGEFFTRSGGVVYDAESSSANRGQSYTYYAVAVDRSGNESVPSELSAVVTMVSVLDGTDFQDRMDELQDAEVTVDRLSVPGGMEMDTTVVEHIIGQAAFYDLLGAKQIIVSGLDGLYLDGSFLDGGLSKERATNTGYTYSAANKTLTGTGAFWLTRIGLDEAKSIPLTQGSQYEINVWAVGAQANALKIARLDDSGYSYITTTYPTPDTLRAVVDVPAPNARLNVYAGASRTITRVQMREAVGTTLIKPGSVTTNALAANKAMIDELLSHAILADYVEAGSFVGAVFTGSFFQNRTESNRGWKLDDTGMRFYSNTGTVFADIDGTRGNFNGVTLTGGTVRTAATSTRLEMNTDAGASTLTAYYSNNQKSVQIKAAPTSGSLEFFSSDGGYRGSIFSYSSGLRIEGGSFSGGKIALGTHDVEIQAGQLDGYINFVLPTLTDSTWRIGPMTVGGKTVAGLRFVPGRSNMHQTSLAANLHMDANGFIFAVQ